MGQWVGMMGGVRRGLVLVGLVVGFALNLGWAQAPSTAVQDTVYRADGQPAAGTVVVSWGAFTTADGTAISAGTATATLGAGGVLSMALAPNAGATPMGSYYTAVFHLNDGTVSREFWVIPATVPGGGAAKLAGIRNQVLPTSVAMQTVTKAYVDTTVAKAVAGIPPASSPFVLRAGDTLTGPLVLPGDPASANQAADKNYVDESIAAAANGTIAATRLPVFGASGAGHAAGAVPDPGATAGSSRYLREDGTWTTPAGGSGSGSPTGTAGGDLSGTYPSPAVSAVHASSGTLDGVTIGGSAPAAANFTNASISGTATLPNGAAAGGFLGGTWIDMPTSGPSALGSGGPGNNPWVAYVAQGGQYLANASTGDIVYRNGLHGLLFGNVGNAEMMIRNNEAFFGQGQQTTIDSSGNIVANSLATNGSVGVGTTAPAALLAVGVGSPFQVDGQGNVTAARVKAAAVASGTSANSDLAGQLTMSAGTASFAFAGVYSTAPICTATDASAAVPVRVQVSATGLTVNGSGTDVVNYVCIARL